MDEQANPAQPVATPATEPAAPPATIDDTLTALLSEFEAGTRPKEAEQQPSKPDGASAKAITVSHWMMSN